MRLSIPNIPATALAKRVIRELQARGHEAFLAGGCVRDLILKREPKDYDVATSALPDAVEALFPRSIAQGKAFGVIQVLGDTPGVSVEVATFRHDGPYSDGRHPDNVRFTTAEEDAARRDFTINAMFLDASTGEVVDTVGGMADLERKVIRAVGDPAVRFTEDKLRLLRAVRFASSLNFEIEDATWEAIKRMAAQVTVCSAERIRDELIKMLTARGASRGVRLMFECGLLQAVLPEIAAMYGVQQPPQYHPEGDVFTHTLLALDLLPSPCSITLALGVLLHDVGKPPTYEEAADRIRFHGHDELGAKMSEKITRRLKFPSEVTERVASLVRDHLKFMHARKMKLSTLKRFLRKPYFDEDLELHRIDCLAGKGEIETWKFCREKLAEFKREGEQQALRPKSHIDGRDLIALGMQPGPKFKEILEALEDEVLEGRIRDREQAIAFVKAYKPGA
ncbi:MAG: CCA tRNA nucleotidyltransferase [Planctomycetes bacterium]|nr:CCA tRNA nucleotidyltransferase [Planctomycetota bacterium]